MDQYCVMGNPVAHSQSPDIHARFAELCAQRLQYSKRLVPLDGFAHAVQAFRAEGGRGCNVTVPFKFAAAALATRLSKRAQLAQAANLLAFAGEEVFADNTDGAGLVRDIEDNAGVALAGRRILLLGAGGAAAGVLGPLLMARPASLSVANRTQARAMALVARHQDPELLQKTELLAPELRGLAGDFDVIINATASSLQGADLPIAATLIRPGTLVYDMMYGPLAAPFLNWARQHGAHARDGLGMLVEQAAEAFALWRGVRPPAAQVLAELRSRLAAA